MAKRVSCKRRTLKSCKTAKKTCKVAKGHKRTFCRKRRNTKHK